MGRYSADDEQNPITYVSPLEKIANVSGSYYGVNASLAANWSDGAEGPAAVEIFRQDNLNFDSSIYDTLCIKASFKCLLSGYDITSGSYGVLVTLKNEVGKSVQVQLNSINDMFGNPYSYLSFFEQQQAFKISEPIGNITSIEAYFYQDGNFKFNTEDGDELSVPVQSIGSNKVLQNIFIENFEFYFGSDVSSVENRTVKIFTQDDLNYYFAKDENGEPILDSEGYNIGLKKTVSLIWYNKTEDNKFVGFEEGIFNKDYAKGLAAIPEGDNNSYYWIEWYIDSADGVLTSLNSEQGDLQQITLECLPSLTFTRVKAKLYLNGVVYESANNNIIEFTNLDIKADAIANLGIKLTLKHHDWSQDSYPYYGEDNKIIDNQQAIKTRIVGFEWTWERGQITDEYWQGSKVIWSVPINSTMIQPVGTVNENGLYYEIVYQNIDDIESARYFKYRIKDFYHSNYINNIIKCRIELPEEKGGFAIEAEKALNFSSFGVSGTDYTLTVYPSNNRIFGFTENDFPIANNFEADLLDPEGKLIQDANISISKSEGMEQANLQIEGYNVLQASIGVEWSGQDVLLETQYPVVYSKDGLYYAQAPLKIIYDSFGTLIKSSQYMAPLKLFYFETNEEIEGVVWRMYYTGSEAEGSWLPQLNLNSYQNTYSINLPISYIDSGCYTYLVAYLNNIPVWSQPLLMQQYRYGSEILNNWDGNLVIDKKGNKILTNTLAAGKKNSDNTFSGVVFGEVTKITENGIDAETGLLGYHHGAQSFGFRDDGTAFIGMDKIGRIEFDGTKGLIQSGNYAAGASGMQIDLQQGSIDAYNFKLSSKGIKLDSDASSGNYLHIGDNSKYIKYTEDEKLIIAANNFSLDADGNVSFKGDITGSTGTFTGAIKAANFEANQTSTKIGGWTANSNSLTTNVADGYIGLYSSYPNSKVVIAGSIPKDDWRIVAGTGIGSYNFGVDKTGHLYATGAHISGTITASEGKIGPLSIAEKASLLRITQASAVTNTYKLKVSPPENEGASVVVIVTKIPKTSGSLTKDHLTCICSIENDSGSLFEVDESPIWEPDGLVKIKITKKGPVSFSSALEVKVEITYKLDGSFCIDASGVTNIHKAYIEDLQSPVIDGILQRLENAGIVF